MNQNRQHPVYATLFNLKRKHSTDTYIKIYKLQITLKLSTFTRVRTLEVGPASKS